MFGWLIEHILLLIPTWAWLALAVAGALIYYFSKFILIFPDLKPYGLAIKLFSIVAVLGGVFMTGGEGVTAIWQAQIADMNKRVLEAEAKSTTVNTKIETKIVEKIKLVKDTQVVIQDRIVEKEKIIDAECKVAPEAIDILNQSAKFPGGKK